MKSQKDLKNLLFIILQKLLQLIFGQIIKIGTTISSSLHSDHFIIKNKLRLLSKKCNISLLQLIQMSLVAQASCAVDVRFKLNFKAPQN